MFLMGVLFARVLGAERFGAYAYAMSWAMLLSWPAMLGLDQLLVRSVAVYHEQEQWQLLRGLLSWSALMTLGAATCLTVLALLVWLVARGSLPPELRSVVPVALLLLPILVLGRVVASFQHGLRHVLLSQLPLTIVTPVVAIIAFGTITIFAADYVSASFAVGVQVVASAASLLVGTALLKKHLPAPIRSVAAVWEGRSWLKAAMPLLAIIGLYALNEQIDILVLGSLQGAESAGIFSVAKRGATLVVFPLLAINAALAPTIARFHAAGDHGRLQLALTKSTRVVLILTIMIALPLELWSNFFLQLFGESFSAGDFALKILVLAQVFNCAMGSVGLLLIMTGHDRELAYSVSISTFLKGALLFYCVPIWGTLGAAIAAAASVVCNNLIAATLAIRLLRIDPTALGMDLGATDHTESRPSRES